MDTSSVDQLQLQLPDEIIESILSRCPVESVVRFISVSKSWQSIISNPRFSRIHRIQRSRMLEDQNTFTFFLWEDGRWGPRDYGLHLIRLEDKKFQTKLLGYPSSGKLFEPLCSCNGLIFLRADNKEYMLWNPLLRKHIIIPHPSNPNPKTHRKAFRKWITPKTPHTFHLYHDSITDDYKIVFHYELRCYTVYSCKNGSWGEIKHFPYLDWKECLYGIDGSCLYGMRNDNTEIISFDARDEKIHKFPLPKGVEQLVGEVKLEAVSGRLCLYGYNDPLLHRLNLWVMVMEMEENGSFDKNWRKLINMEKKEPCIKYIWNMRPVYVTNKDDLVLRVAVTSYQGVLTSDHFKYDPYGISRLKQIDRFRWVGELFPYSENLDMPYSNTPSIPHEPRKRRECLTLCERRKNKGKQACFQETDLNGGSIF